MAKKSKKKKKKNLKQGAALFGTGAAAGVAVEVLSDVLRHVVADALDRYFVKGGGKKKLKKRLRAKADTEKARTTEKAATPKTKPATSRRDS